MVAALNYGGRVCIMAKKRQKKNTNFRLGLDRPQLIEAAQMFGKKLKTALKDSTKRLEEYLTNKLLGRGSKVPELSGVQKRDISDTAKKFGTIQGVDLLRYRMAKITGNYDETNYLRLSIREKFSQFIDEPVTTKHVNDLISRMSHLDYYKQISGLYYIDGTIQDIFFEYIEELEDEKSA